MTIFVAYLSRSTMTLGPDDFHFLPILALEALDCIRNLLVEEVGVGRMRMYFVVVRSWPRSFRNPFEVLVQCLDPPSMERREDLNHLIGNQGLTTLAIVLTAKGFPCWVKRVPGSTSSLSWMKVHLIPSWFANSRIFVSRRSSSTSYSMLAYSSLAFHCLRRSMTPVGKVRRGVCVVTYKGIFSSLSDRYASNLG